MGIYRHPNSPYFYYAFTVDGKRVSGSTGTSNKTLARQICETKKADCLRGKVGIVKPLKIQFPDLKKRFLDWSQSHKRSYNRDVVLAGHLEAFFGKRDIADITSLDVEKYKARRVQLVKGATVNREIACLKRMYSLALKWGLAHANPVKGVEFFREPKRNCRWFSEEEIAKFLAVCNPRMRSIFLVGIHTGMRISELLKLRWSQVDFDHNYITVLESKTNEYRKIKMNAVVVEALRASMRNGEFVFANSRGEPFGLINKAFKGTCKRAGIAEATPHAMRHTFASHLMRLGVDAYTIMELGGWKSLEMVMRYSHLAPDHRQVAVMRLEQMHDAIKQKLLKSCLSDSERCERDDRKSLINNGPYSSVMDRAEVS